MSGQPQAIDPSDDRFRRMAAEYEAGNEDDSINKTYVKVLKEGVAAQQRGVNR